jgi:Ca-activated chloride channel family protein
MNSAGFHIDWIAFWLVLAFFCISPLFAKTWTSVAPHLDFSDLSGLKQAGQGWKSRCSRLPGQLKAFVLFLLVIAFIDPHLLVERDASLKDQADEESRPADEESEKIEQVSLPTEGIAIYLVLDQSGSMDEPVSVPVAEYHKRAKIPKIELLKEMTARFIKGDDNQKLSGRRNDLIGLVTFARAAEVVSPLTFDHSILLKHLSRLQSIRENRRNGTAIGYALYKTVNLIAATQYFAKDLVKSGKPSYEIKNTVIVLVTDGLQNPHPGDDGHQLRNIGVLEAAQEAKKHGVRTYIVNVEPGILLPEYTRERNELKKAAELTGGKFYVMDFRQSLSSIYADIDRLEKSVLPIQVEKQAIIEEKSKEQEDPNRYLRINYYPYILGFALFLFATAIVLETTVLRRAP